MGWVRAHKLLLVVYGAGLALAAIELSDPELQPGRPDAPEVYLAPGINIADVSATMYPDRALSLYYRAQQAALCSEARWRETEVCRARGPVAPGEIRDLLERAVETGNRSLELVLYNYAWVLIQEGAPPAEVDAAVEAWRKAHPGSDRPDPRTVSRGRSGRNR
jgi:hypothetical protein